MDKINYLHAHPQVDFVKFLKYSFFCLGEVAILRKMDGQTEGRSDLQTRSCISPKNFVSAIFLYHIKVFTALKTMP